MLELKTKKELATYAFRLSTGSNMVRYRGVTYIPADYETLDTSVVPDIDRTIWLPQTRRDIQVLAAEQFDALFASDSELASFDFMVAQTANQIDKTVDSLLVRTKQGLRELDDEGNLVTVSGDFRPNTVVPMLNTDKKAKAKVFDIFSGWLDSDEEAESLLAHLATCLAPGWSAVKYVLLLGEGRNGKSLMLKMLQSLFGPDNVSHVTRQAMSEQNPVVTELNGKLLNIVYDGRSEYVKDSGYEKSLTAGEPVPIRRLYESTATMVSTNALFIEGLNREPKTSDKSMALQKRLVRFQFPNVYALDHSFERYVRTPQMIGALLSLMVDRYVQEQDVATRLAPTAKAIELQLNQMYANSLGLQFIKAVEETDPLGAVGLLDIAASDLIARFRSWRLKENDLGTWAEPDVLALFAPLLNTERKSFRTGKTVRKVRTVVSFKDEAAAFVRTIKEGTSDDAEILDTLVDE
jgi:phage/plasmid-associated DNA primase